jgi:hypothetical protein
MQLEVLAELQAAIGMRDRQRALDVVGHRLAGRVGDIVHRQDEDVVAHADPAVLAPVALKVMLEYFDAIFDCFERPFRHQRRTFRCPRT